MPQDLRVPFVAAKLNTTDISNNADAWLELHKERLGVSYVTLH
jgi:hypothetical protein